MLDTTRALLPVRKKHQDRYASFAGLAQTEREGVDYRVVLREVTDAAIAIVTPHGGGIERGTTPIARVIAGDLFHLYMFEGLKPRGNFNALHITSRCFDEPRCLELVARTDTIVTVHGCVGLDERVYIGGLHETMKSRIADALRTIGVEAWLDGHTFPATDLDNICNRGRGGSGVQLEFTMGIRRLRQYRQMAEAIRAAMIE